MDNTWKNEKSRGDILNHRLTEAGINRIMKHANEEGMVIISTARSIVVPFNDDNGYDFDSWQSLFPDYVKFCHDKGLPICEERMSDNTDLKTIEDTIIDKGYSLNEESSRKFLEQRNKECDKDLYSYLRSRDNPYNFTATYGGFKGQNGEISDYEPSFIIYNNLNRSKTDRFGNEGWEDLYKRALLMCKEYKQDAVYVQAPGKNPIYVDKDGNKVNTSEGPDFSFNSNDAFFTTTKRKKSSVGKVDNPSRRGVDPHTFTADIGFEELAEHMSIRSKMPGGFWEKMKTHILGEVWNPESF